MNRKTKTIIAILVLTLLLVVGYNYFLSPEGVEGSKEVTIHVINEEENVDESFEYATDHEFLLALLEENQEELGASFETFDFGTMVTGMMDYIADESNSEYFHISIDGEDAMTGPGEIPLNDGETYTFELQNY